MGKLNWLIAAAILLSPWRRLIWPLAVIAILADPSIIDPWSDPEMVRIIEEYRRKYLSMGYPRTIVDLAIKWAVDLAKRMYEKMFSNLPPSEGRKIMMEMLRKYLEWAANYIAGMAGAAAETEARLARAEAERMTGAVPTSTTGGATAVAAV